MEQGSQFDPEIRPGESLSDKVWGHHRSSLCKPVFYTEVSLVCMCPFAVLKGSLSDEAWQMRMELAEEKKRSVKQGPLACRRMPTSAKCNVVTKEQYGCFDL